MARSVQYRSLASLLGDGLLRCSRIPFQARHLHPPLIHLQCSSSVTLKTYAADMPARTVPGRPRGSSFSQTLTTSGDNNAGSAAAAVTKTVSGQRPSARAGSEPPPAALPFSSSTPLRFPSHMLTLRPKPSGRPSPNSSATQPQGIGKKARNPKNTGMNPTTAAMLQALKDIRCGPMLANLQPARPGTSGASAGNHTRPTAQV